MSHQSDLIATDIHAYLKQHENKEMLRLLTCGSVDDGKSTLIGRLLYDSKLIFEEGVRPWSNPMGAAQFGSTFFMITGFHGLHVSAGVIYLLVIANRVRNGFYEERGGNYEIVEITGLYWHFVDLVWVFIFAFFYLW